MIPRALLCLLLLQISHAQDLRPASVLFHGRASDPKPNVELPGHIAKMVGRGISLVADPATRNEKGIPLYLINKGGKEVQMPCQDNDLYVKLEAQLPDQSWQRAQAHVSSWCGNSYYTLSLPAGQHFKFYGYQPKKGRPALIRYTIHHGDFLSSQVFDGLVSDQDIADAKVDTMSVSNIPGGLIGALPGFPLRSAEDFKRYRQSWTTREELVSNLILWKQFGEVPRISKLAKDLSDGLEHAPTDDPEAQAFVKKVRTLLQLPFHPEASSQRLMEFCLEEVQKETASDPSTPLPSKRICWQALDSLCRRNLVPIADQQNIFSLALTGEFRTIFRQSAKVDEFLTTEQLWNTLETAEDQYFRGEVWAVLLRRNLKDEVIKSLSGQHQRDRGTVLKQTLRQTKGSWFPLTPDEKTLWSQEFAADPIMTSFALNNRFHQDINRHPFQFLEQPAREYWLDQLKKSDSADEDFENEGLRNYCLGSVRFLQKVESEFDPAFWQQLTRYRGYTVEEYYTSAGGTSRKVIDHRFYVRAEAAKILKERGHKVEVELPDKVTISDTPWKPVGE